MARLFGLFADLSGKQVLVVGGGEVAERKTESLLKAGANIIVGAPEITDLLGQWQQAGKLRHIQGEFEQSWLDGCWIVVAATDNRPLNKQIAAACKQRQILINVVDDAELCDFHTPSIIDRGPLQIAISTAGAAPAIGRKIRADIEARLDRSLGGLVRLTQRYRDKIVSRFPDMAARRRFYDSLIKSPIARSLEKQQVEQAEQQFEQALAQETPPQAGRVTLLGGGPGDPGLLTLKGQNVLQDADVILYDRLVSEDVLALARRDAELVYVGKKPNSPRITQARINNLLVQYAKQGHHVVRLKGGDPFIFGRGGEELQYLREHGIGFEVVPGITAASACASYAGIPLTHRNFAQSVRFVTAHGQRSIDRLDWEELAKERQTIAFYMGVSQFGNIQSSLIKHGRKAQTPIAIIEKGTRQEQRVVTGQLGDLVAVAKQHEVTSPALLILGEVASLANELSWFGQAPIQAAVAKNQAEIAPSEVTQTAI